MISTRGVTFTAEELWLLRACVRHEMSGQEVWKFPPSSLELNEQIALALLLCDEGAGDAALELSKGDCLVIDYCVPQDAKSAKGAPMGKEILVKVFRARRELSDGFPSAEEEGQRMAPEDMQEALRSFASKEE